MTDSLVTARVEEARVLLAEARTLDDVKDLVDKAAALALYARQRAAASGAHADAWEIQQLAQRRMGQITRELPTAPAGRKAKQQIRSELEPISKAEAIASVGLSKTQVHRWEGLATLDDIEWAARIKDGRETITKQGDAGGGVASTSSKAGYDGDSYGTPAEWLDAGRKALGGGFDLDPATNADAQKLVQAERLFTKADNGLDKPWTAKRLWCNPPYSRGLCAEFAAKFIAEHEAGHMKAGLLLVNAATDTAWFHSLLEHGCAFCLVQGRIAFLYEGTPIKGNEYSQALFYAGHNAKRFKQAFSKFGKVMVML